MSHSSFLPKMNAFQERKFSHLFQSSSFTDTTLAQRATVKTSSSISTLFHHLISTRLLYFKKVTHLQNRDDIFSNAGIIYQPYVALNEGPHVSPLLVLSFVQLDFFWMTAKTWCFTKSHCFQVFREK